MTGAVNPQEKIAGIVELLQQLVQTPSRGGVDPPGPVIDVLTGWLAKKGLPYRILRNGSQDVGVLIEISGSRNGPIYTLDACLDTAPFGDIEAWRVHPTAGEIIDGWLFGRGTADSKAAVAVFAHVAAELVRTSAAVAGELHVLFDADEHTGRFGGVKAYMDYCARVAGMMIGYPGNYGVSVGARGFYRATITVYGTAAHSGASRVTSENAIVKASLLVQKLGRVELPLEQNPAFKFGPKLTVTAIRGGSSYSIVPDRCDVSVDFRLTPSVAEATARDLVKRTVADVDADYPTRLESEINEEESWPAYKLNRHSRVAVVLRRAASIYSGRRVPVVVSGPSNIGNYLAFRGVDATCGYGVTYKNLHGTDECIEIASIEMVYLSYLHAVRELLAHDSEKGEPTAPED